MKPSISEEFVILTRTQIPSNSIVIFPLKLAKLAMNWGSP